MYLIITDDVYEDMIRYNDMFDFSDYPSDHKVYKLNIIGKGERGKHVIKNYE